MSEVASWLLQSVRLEVERPRVGDEPVNLIPNPSGDLGAWGWATPLSGTVLRAVEASGVRSLVFTSPGGAASHFVSEATPVAAGRHVAAGWLAAQVTGRYTVQVEWINNVGAVFASAAVSALIAASVDRQVYGTVQAPVGTVSARLRFDHHSTGGGNPTAGATLTVREVTLLDAASSTNLRTVRTNLVANPTGEVNATGWAASPASTVSSSTAAAYVGSRSLLFERAAKGNLAAASAAMPVTAGRDYTLTCRLRPRTTVRRALIYARWLDAGAARIGADVLVSSYQEVASTWSGVRGGTATAPSTAASVQFVVVWGQVAAGEGHFLDAVMVEEGTAATGYFDGSTPAAGGVTYAWTGTAHASASTATTGTGVLPPLAPVLWQNILAPVTDLTTSREDMQLGTMEVTLRDPSLDPATSPLIRAGRRARLVTAAGQSIFNGRIVPDSIGVEYEPLVRDVAKRTKVSFTVTDATTALSSNTRPEGVATIAELPHVLEGCGVPWSVNGSGDQVPSATVVAYNSASTAMDQVIVTRDTARGFAWVDRNGVVQAWDRNLVPTDQKAFLDESVYGPTFASGFDPKSCVNVVEVVALTVVATTGAVEEVRYGPYRGEESIAENGECPGSYTVQGTEWNEAAAAAYAAEVLATNADPRRRVREATVAITDESRLPLALLDLQDRVHVQNALADIAEVSRVTSVRHALMPGRGWLVTLGFAGESVAALPVAVTAPPPVQAALKADVDVEVAAVATVADEAATAASTAQTTASNAATAASTAQTTASNAATAAATAQTTASNAATAASNAATAAAGKSKVTYSASTPGLTPNAAGDVWFQTASGVVLTQWQGNGGTSWTERKVSGTALAADAVDGKVITGATLRTAASGRRIVIEDDGGGAGIVEWWAGLDGEEPGYVDPFVEGDKPGVAFNTGTSFGNAERAYLKLRAGSTSGVPNGRSMAVIEGTLISLRCSSSGYAEVLGGPLDATMGDGSVGVGDFRDSVDARVDARVEAGGGAAGYATLTLAAGVTGTVQYRKVGQFVHIEGSVTFASLANNANRSLVAAGVLPVGARPPMSLNIPAARVNLGTESGLIQRLTDGAISVTNKSGVAVTTAQFAYSYLVA